METTALYFAVFTLAVVALLSAMVILPRRWIRRARKAPEEPRVRTDQLAYFLVTIVGVGILFLVEPWLGFASLVAAGILGVAQLWRLPEPGRTTFYSHMQSLYRKPFFRAMDYTFLLGIALIALIAAWKAFH